MVRIKPSHTAGGQGWMPKLKQAKRCVVCECNQKGAPWQRVHVDFALPFEVLEVHVLGGRGCLFQVMKVTTTLMSMFGHYTGFLMCLLATTGHSLD